MEQNRQADTLVYCVYPPVILIRCTPLGRRKFRREHAWLGCALPAP